MRSRQTSTLTSEIARNSSDSSELDDGTGVDEQRESAGSIRRCCGVHGACRAALAQQDDLPTRAERSEYARLRHGRKGRGTKC